MPNTRLIEAFMMDEPDKTFEVCDLDEGRDFLDPLDLYSVPYYDLYEKNEQGLFAIGGKIDAPTLISAYSFGIFPWYSYKDFEEAYWFCPRERFVIFPERIHVSHSLRNLLNKGKYSISINKAFREVIHNCRMVDDRDCHINAWLGDTIEHLFIELHKRGYAKSVEVWEGDELVGGFYGFWYNGVFQGESMFSLRHSASQIGLIMLSRHPYIEGQKIKIIDTQFGTPTFKKLGGEYISYKTYRDIMDA